MSTVTSHWKLRRLGPRGVRIANRRASESPAVAAFQETLFAKNAAYVAAYDKAAKFQAAWKKEMAEGRGAIAALLKLMQTWLPLLKRDIPGFDGGIYGDKPAVPDDVIEDGERLAQVIDEFRDASGKPLAYQKAALDQLTPVLQAAMKEWAEAEATDKQYQAALAAVRDSADPLQQELVALRRTLGVTLGRKDKDYQKLRAERAGYPDEDDDANAPPPPKPVTPAAPGAGPQAAM